MLAQEVCEARISLVVVGKDLDKLSNAGLFSSGQRRQLHRNSTVFT